MQRPIKFRAWDKNLREMFYADNLTIFSWRSDSHEFMQYTGLKDRNGKEIYEGDYVVVPERIHMDEEGVVEYNHTGQYVLAQGSFKTSIHELVFNKWKIEVIGNIYENPDLLPQKGKT